MDTLKKQSLFWDIHLNELDPTVNERFIVKRILQFGDRNDFRWAIEYYGKDAVKETFMSAMDCFDNKSRNFWCLYFNIFNEKQCTMKPSMRKQSAFWTR